MVQLLRGRLRPKSLIVVFKGSRRPSAVLFTLAAIGLTAWFLAFSPPPINLWQRQWQPQQLQPGKPLAVNSDELEQRCWGVKGDWCEAWLAQAPIKWTTPVPRGEKECLWNCNGVGVCDSARGWCRCPAGWMGDACDVRMRRPCSQKRRDFGFEAYGLYDKSIDWDWEWSNSMKCAGECDEDIGFCFCPRNTTYGRIPAEVTAPPATPPTQYGRPMSFVCQPNKRPGSKSNVSDTPFGDQPPEKLFGRDGWCQAETPRDITCACLIDGLLGERCEVPVEHFCPNQCSAHGDCVLGFCNCHEGFFGQDCAHRLPGVEWTHGEVQAKPWLVNHALAPAAQDPAPGATRKRPLIYVYELPPMYNQLMLQYRNDRDYCTHRLFNENNATEFTDSIWLYAVETALHEAILQSKYRTLDPEEADFFYMPVYIACLFHPVLGAADFPYFHGGPSDDAYHRPSAGVNMLIEAWSWARSHMPYWERQGGRDHIILMPHDEGSCYLPAVLRNATMLAHWGRTDPWPHHSYSGYDPDRYDVEMKHPAWQPEGHVAKLGKFPCYDPTKDLIIPPMYSPVKFPYSPLFGAEEQARDTFAFFKGDLRRQDEKKVYSRGIRQALHKLCSEKDWWGRHRIWIGDEMPATEPHRKRHYSLALASSAFCFVLPGDGWSARFEDAIMHGCVPVIIQDGIDVTFESILEFSRFTVRIAQKDLERIPEILEKANWEELAAGVRQVWQRYQYGSYKAHVVEIGKLRQVWKEEVDDRAEKATAKSGGGGGGGGNAAAEGDRAAEEKGVEAAVRRLRRRTLLKKKRVKKQKGVSVEAGKRHKVWRWNGEQAEVDTARDDAFETIMAWLHGKLLRWEEEETASSSAKLTR